MTENKARNSSITDRVSLQTSDEIRFTGSLSERETLMCLRGNNNRTNTGKIRRPERELNPRLTDFMTGAQPLSYRGNYSGMG